MSVFTCDLCRVTDLRPDDRIFIHGKCRYQILSDLESLSRTPDTDFICCRCYQFLKKRRRLCENLKSIEKTFQTNQTLDESNNVNSCNLCLAKDLKARERYLVNSKGKFDIRSEIQHLGVRITSEYICRTCFRHLKKRKQLLQELNEITLTQRAKKRSQKEISGSQSETLVPTTPTKISRRSSEEPIHSTPSHERLTAPSLQWPVSPFLCESNEETTTPNVESPVPQAEAHKEQVDDVECHLVANVESSQLENVQTGKAKSNVEVSVEVSWPSKTVNRNLSGELQSLGKFLAIGTYQQIARAAWKIPDLKKEMCKLYAHEVENEATNICSKKDPSILRKTDKDSMSTLSMEKVSQEIETKAPLFYAVLKASSTNRLSIQRGYDSAKENDFAALAMAASICIRNRCKQMNAVQLLITTFIYHSSWMSTLARLSKARLVTSHTFFYKKLDEFGKDFNLQIKEKVMHQSKLMAQGQETHLGSMESATNSEPVVEEKETHPPEANAEAVNVAESVIIEEHPPDANLEKTNSAEPVVGDMGRKLTFDNIDYKQEVHYMTEENQNKDNHYVTFMSTENRISGAHLSNEIPVGGVMEIENGKCMPDSSENSKQRDDYICLVEHVITSNIPCLLEYKELATHHIPHCYKKETRCKTDTTFLGMIYESENDSDGILEIMKAFHEYTPYAGDGEERIYGHLGVVGDQLSVERAVNGHMTLANGFTPEERVEGLNFEIADWHAGNKFLEVAYSNLYNAASSGDKCTLYCDRTLINRRNVKKDVSSAANACRRFFVMEVEARIVAATIKVLGMSSLDGKPTKNTYTGKKSKKEYLKGIASEVVDSFVIDKEFNNYVKESAQIIQQQKEMPDADGRFPCRVAGCSRTFASAGKWRKDHEASHNPPYIEDTPYSKVLEYKREKNDDMFNYQKALLDYGMLILNFFDAISEGDGARVFRCWKFFLMYLKHQGTSTKYSLEALYLMFQAYGLLSPKNAHQLIWNRFIKNKAGPAGNIPLDLQLEFFNKSVKQALKNLGPNASRRSMDRICHAIGFTNLLIHNFDNSLDVFKRSGKHVKKSIKGDLEKVVKELVSNDAFTFTPGRSYRYFSGMRPSILSGFNMHEMFEWINSHKKYMILSRRAR